MATVALTMGLRVRVRAAVLPYAQLAASDGWTVREGVGGPGGDLTRHIMMNDPGLPEIRREYIVHVPDAYTALADPASLVDGTNKHTFPVLWYFHGQGMNPDLSIQETDYNQVGWVGAFAALHLYCRNTTCHSLLVLHCAGGWALLKVSWTGAGTTDGFAHSLALSV